MIINQESADKLCNRILEEVVKWPAVDAALQCGGLEVKTRGRIESAIVAWLRAHHPTERLAVLPEYTRSPDQGRGKNIDFAVIEIDPPSGAYGSFLSVKALFEVKFNYASQTGQKKARGGEFRARLTPGKGDAIAQALRYKSNVQAESAFVLYLVADPKTEQALPREPRDSGWKYFDDRARRENRVRWKNRQDIGIGEAKRAIELCLSLRNLHIRGEHTIEARGINNLRDCSFYCCLIEATDGA
jgi:hypothetical protein